MLKILVINEVSPQIKNRTSILFEKIIPILSKKNKIEIVWLSSDEIRKNGSTNFSYESLYWKNFRTAREVIEKIKPSLIYLFPGQSTIDYSFLLTARLLKIPTCGWVEGTPMFTYNKGRKKFVLEAIRKFFERKQIDEENSSFRGINFIKKNLFFVRSAKAIGKSYNEIISDLFQQFKRLFYFEMKKEDSNTKFNCDLLLIENEYSIEYGEKHGLSKNNMVIVGDPNYDFAFTMRNNNKKKKDTKLKVLFITVNLSSYAKSDWSAQKQNKMIEELSREYENLKDKFSLSIKIHPISEDFNQYKKNLEKHSQNIELFQREDIYKLIEDADIILTTATSTAGSIALIMKKPIIILDYFHVVDDLFLNSNVAMRCKNISEMADCITKSNSFNINNKSTIDKFIKEFFGEGKSIEKIVDAIENIHKSK